MLTYNQNQLVEMAVNAKVDHPRVKGYRGGFDGRARITVATGGITYSHAIGDCCMHIAGDHVEPGVSMANPNPDENMAVETFSCIGNPVYCLSGPAAGAKGYVTGTHGGIEHTMAYFKAEDLERMEGNENFLIRTYGQGLKVDQTPDVFWMNIDPRLLNVMNVDVDDQGQLRFPVATIIPAFLMGSGLGSSTMMSGDYDIMTQDKEANEQFGLNDLRFGDFVAILDHDCTYGPHYKKGAVSVGVIVHSDSFTSGHGPGVAIVATSQSGAIMPFVSDQANLKHYFSKMENE